MSSINLSTVYPILAMILLTFLVTAKMFSVRVQEMKTFKINPQSISTRTESAQNFKNKNASDNLQNLFEMPVLFYVLSVLFILLQKSTSITLYLMWSYVFCRYIHSYIHCTSNKVMHRFYAFLPSMMILFLLFFNLIFTLI
jgi:hypothetical protein